MPRRTSRLNPDGWIGEQLSVGASNERFFRGYRVDGEAFHVGDFVLVKVDSYGEPQVMKIDALFEDASGERYFEGRWYYPPEDTSCGRLVGHDPREVFETVHVDEHLIECIDGHCTVMEWDAYQQWLDQPAGDDDNHEDETTFVCRAAYHPGSGEFVPLTGASSLAEAARVAGGRQEAQRQQQQQQQMAAASSKQRGKRPVGMDGGAAVRGGALPSSSAASAASWAAVLDEVEEGSASAATARVAARKRRRLGRFAEAAARLAPSAAPERMPCREKERDEVIGVLRSAVLEGALGGSLYLSGTPGTGKTATVHQALRALTQEKGLPPFRTIFVNGMKLSSPYDVYSLLWEALTGQAAKPARALELLEKRFTAPNVSGGGGGSKGGGGGGSGREAGVGGDGAVVSGAKRRAAQGQKVIVILDELDYLVTSKQSVIYNLFEWATRGSSHMLVVGISNTMDLPERLLPRVESRLNIRRVNFLPYTHQDIEAIIADRLGSLDAFGVDGAEEGKGDKGGVELCARKVASVSGDVRRALEICRTAAQVAEREEAAAHEAQAGAGNGGGWAQPIEACRYVTTRHISEALKRINGSNYLVAIQAAPIQHKLLLGCMVILMSASGRSEVEEATLRHRHRAICMQLDCPELPCLSGPEQNEVIARLLAARLVDTSSTPQMLRLTVQPEDVKATIRTVPRLAHLFPQPQA